MAENYYVTSKGALPQAICLKLFRFQAINKVMQLSSLSSSQKTALPDLNVVDLGMLKTQSQPANAFNDLLARRVDEMNDYLSKNSKQPRAEEKPAEHKQPIEAKPKEKIESKQVEQTEAKSVENKTEEKNQPTENAKADSTEEQPAKAEGKDEARAEKAETQTTEEEKSNLKEKIQLVSDTAKAGIPQTLKAEKARGEKPAPRMAEQPAIEKQLSFVAEEKAERKSIKKKALPLVSKDVKELIEAFEKSRDNNNQISAKNNKTAKQAKAGINDVNQKILNNKDLQAIVTTNVSRETIDNNPVLNNTHLHRAVLGQQHDKVIKNLESSSQRDSGGFNLNNSFTQSEKAASIARTVTQPTQNQNLDQQFQAMMQRAKIVVRDKENARLTAALYPKELGKVSLKLALVEGTLHGRFFVENENVQRELMARLDKISDDLRADGFEVSEFSVDVQSQESSESFQARSGQQSNHNAKAGASYLEAEPADNQEEGRYA